MKGIKRIFLESKKLHAIIGIIGFLCMIIVSKLIKEGLHPTSIFLVIFHLPIIFSLAIGAYTSKYNMKFGLVLNHERKKLSKEIMSYFFVTSAILAIIILSFGMLYHLLANNLVIPMVFGSNWNVFVGSFERYIMLFVIFFTAVNAGAFLGVSIKTDGKLITVCKMICIFYILFLFKDVISYAYVWGTNVPLVMAIIGVLGGVLMLNNWKCFLQYQL